MAIKYNTGEREIDKFLNFYSLYNKNYNAVCDCCGGTGKVLVLKYPIVSTDQHGNESVNEKTLFLCDTCKHKMAQALERN